MGGTWKALGKLGATPMSQIVDGKGGRISGLPNIHRGAIMA